MKFSIRTMIQEISLTDTSMFLGVTLNDLYYLESVTQIDDEVHLSIICFLMQLNRHQLSLTAHETN